MLHIAAQKTFWKKDEKQAEKNVAEL